MIQPGALRGAPTRATWLETEVVRDEAGFTALRDAWDPLMEESQASVFSAWEWLHPWLRLPGERRPFLLLVRERMRGLVGLLPLYLQTRRAYGVRYRRLGLMGDERVGSDHLGALLRRGVEGEALCALVDNLLLHRTEWDVLELLDVDADSPSLHVLLEHLRRAGLGVSVQERCECPHEVFEPGLTFERFLARTQRAENYLRRRRWLERQAGYRLERTESGEGVQRALSTFFRLHALRWGDASPLNAPEVQAFHREAATGLAERGRLRLYTLWVGENAVASVYGLRHGGTFSYYNAGTDPAWRNKSVGLVLVGATFEDALTEGAREYDFLRGTEPYKAEWTTRVRKTLAVRVWQPGGPGAWVTHAERLERETRRRLKSMLPEKALAELRRLRKAAV